MQKRTEKRGNWEIDVYKISIDNLMMEEALNFAKDIILSDNQYSRLLPKELRECPNIEKQKKIEIQRTYMGKLGELVFKKFLEENKKIAESPNMLDVFEGQKNVDEFDFITKDRLLVDIKTGFRKKHTRLLINVEQFEKKCKDFYVAIKIDAKDVNSKEKLIDWYEINSAEILGYAEYDYIKNNAQIYDFSEGPARYIDYNRLMGIDKLLKLF